MRLLSTNNYAFKDFLNPDRANYAILSHTWEEDEILFKETTKQPPGLEQKLGYRKIIGCAKVSQKLGYDWVWIDTCCIDKRSSAELTEAINSMFAWYSKAGTCLVYLFDVHGLGGRSSSTWSDDDLRKLKESRWFTRGWTLQELIAPRHVEFYDSQWNKIEYDKLLADAIISTTLIPKELIHQPNEEEAGSSTTRARLDRYSVAQKMSWAAHRSTTMNEDIAYCLLGIFDVNIPLLYGEGEKAFQRLQEEIIKKSSDRTLFMWRDPVGDEFSYRGLLSRAPVEFTDCGDCTNNALPAWQRSKILPYVVTHQGLQMQMGIERLDDHLRTQYGISSFRMASDLYLISFWGVLKGGKPVAIVVERLQPGGIHFSRVMTGTTLPILEGYQRVVNSEFFFVREPSQSYMEVTNPVVYAFDVKVSKSYVIKNDAITCLSKLGDHVFKARTFWKGQYLAFDMMHGATSTRSCVIIGYFAREQRPIRLNVIDSSQLSHDDIEKHLQQGVSLLPRERYTSHDTSIGPISFYCEPRMQDDRVIYQVDIY